LKEIERKLIIKLRHKPHTGCPSVKMSF